MGDSPAIPVIDIFAGPGGLGEGFSSFQESGGHRPFQIRLSVEKDAFAHETLRLRSFYRQFPPGEAPDLYYDVLRRELPINALPEYLKEHTALFAKWKVAEQDALHAELGSAETTRETVSRRIRQSVGRNGTPWVLIGGPPCQAYSIVGRVRNKGISDYRIETDQRSSLYREYLRIIADHWPTVFVMENVKGILSAKVHNQSVFDRIIGDLESPIAAFGSTRKTGSAQRYRIVPIVQPSASLLRESIHPRDFIVPCESYGIPQVRHRVILVGIREDLGSLQLPSLKPARPPSVNDVIGDLPALRSGLSRRRVGLQYIALPDSPDLWCETLVEQTVRNAPQVERRWLRSLPNESVPNVRDLISKVVQEMEVPAYDRGGEFLSATVGTGMPRSLRPWYLDDRLAGVCNHESRVHMDTDLARYLFASCFAVVHKVSPKLPDFPADLQPDHDNAASGDFDDRFRVQVADRPSTTITSHISKDGHYFIHPDPAQCRSLTVREAARLQTFPDNYLFCGPRTAQYVQVGNAVPPRLACQIAQSVWGLLVAAGKVG
ncbi:MAG: DNA cytosine methyltransferase [Planctomycetota bacterium]|nr:DNA cytosine methyltransferase [Planctomycetota bacterium]